MTAIAAIKRHKLGMVEKYAKSDDWKGLFQVLTTLLPLAALWLAAAVNPQRTSPITMAVIAIGMSLLLLRSFSLMHDCGHDSLFRSRALNRLVGFVFGVITGMPQYVWSRHHNYHHANNGNWARYQGPLSILPVSEFDALPRRKQRLYAALRTIWLAPVGGLMYLIVNPRVNWLRGTAALLGHYLLKCMGRSQGSFKPRYWASRAEYWHMTANNLALLGAWAIAIESIGAGRFFPIYLISASLGGGLGIVLFTVQHNFEHSYASGDEGWDYHAAAIEGTSYLALPAWMNWFTADIGYHHVHHISARIPNYRLAACHAEYREHFSGVKRLTLGDVRKSLSYLLWDPVSRRILSIEEHLACAEAGTTIACSQNSRHRRRSAGKKQ